jgi:hypothetical protein
MNTVASPSDPVARDRAVSFLELCLHVQRLIDSGRLPRADGEAVVRCMSALAGHQELDA